MATVTIPPSDANKKDFPVTFYELNGIRHWYWRKHSVKRLAYDILNVNRHTIYTSVNMIGLPGWGKTTSTWHLVHEITEIDPQFSVHWHFKEDILKIDKILKALPKQQPVIIIFDDVSWLLDNLERKKRNDILHKLTTIREIIDPLYKRTRVILLMDFHYSYAVPKAFRQSSFAVQLSITNEERENYLKTIGHSQWNKRKILAFTKILESAYKYNKFQVKSPNRKAPYIYETDNPFRPAMVFNMSQIHLMLFHEVKCNKCGPKTKFEKPDPQLWIELVRQRGLRNVLKNTRITLYKYTGKVSWLEEHDQKILRHINDEMKAHNLPLEAIEEVLSKAHKAPKEEQEKIILEGISKIEGRERERLENLKKGSAQATDAPIEEDIDTGDDLDYDNGVNQVAGKFDDDEEDDLDASD